MLYSSLRSRRHQAVSEPSSPALPPPMARFGFSIRTRSGVLIENLAIPGVSAEEAERKLRQIYMGCSVVARFVPEAVVGVLAGRRQP